MATRMITATWIATIACFGCLLHTGSALAQIEVEAALGEPFGVGKITLSPPSGTKTDPYGNGSLSILEKNSRVFYPSFDKGPVLGLLQSLGDVPERRVVAYFLFRGKDPLDLTLHAPTPYTARVTPVNNPRLRNRLLRQWWRGYSSGVQRRARKDEYPGQVESYLTAMLARRLELSPPRVDRRWFSQNELDQAIGTLLGTESIRIAMQKRRLLDSRPTAEAIDQPLPKPTTIPPVVYPEVIGKVEIETIAMHVPHECFYVRFGSFGNFQWMRSLLENSGSDLRNMISLRGVDYQMGPRVERQIALKETALGKLFGGAVISDVALIGTDTFVREGAAIGIVFEARNNTLLGEQIKGQRAEVALKDKRVTRRIVTIGGHEVSLLSRPDNRVRSFYAVDGNYHLVTTSRTLVERFYQAGQSKRSLGGSKEFRYARSVMPLTRGDTVFVYLSDEFFRNLLSPAYRVEMTRRMQALTDIDLIHLARLAARAEGKPHASITDLIRGDFLPRSFGKRPDGSTLTWSENGHLLDSMRGARGSFLPVPDVKIERVTQSEVEAYHRFSRYYQSQWQRLDPVIIGIRRAKSKNTQTERIVVDVNITPFARMHYDLLARMFGPPTRERVAPIPGGLATFEMALGDRVFWSPQLSRRHIFGGLRDMEVPYSISNGRVRPKILAMDIQGYLGAWPAAGLTHLFTSAPLGPVDAQGYRKLPDGILLEGMWERRFGRFSVISFKKPALQRITSQLIIKQAQRPAQLRIQIGELATSKLAPLIHAMGYAHARKISAANTRFLHSLSNQLKVPREDCLRVAENLLDAKMICPLGGEYSIATQNNHLPTWVSTAWKGPNQYQVTQVPADYRFPAIDWFRSVDLEFSLVQTNLSAHVELELKKKQASKGIFGLPGLKPAAPVPPK